LSFRSALAGRRSGRPARLGAIILFFAAVAPVAQAAEPPSVRGAYLLRAAGCTSCHTAEGGKPLAGGRALETPFGTFYSPNITPDPETGIGGWSGARFLDALKRGKRQDGGGYYPVFPYTTYAKMRDEDALAIKAYLDSLQPVANPVPAHDIGFPFSIRWLMTFWQALFFDGTEFRPPAGASPAVARGAYLVEALAHCGECHTPRNAFGALDRKLWLAGTADGPEGELAPNITPDPATGIGGWSTGEIAALLKDGTKPDFDNVQGTMAEAIRDGLAHLSEADRQAIAAYLKTVLPVANKVERRR